MLRPGRWVVIAIGLLGVAGGVSVVSTAYAVAGEDNPALWAFLRSWVVLPYIAAGLVAWRRRPDSRMGQLMIVAGVVTSLDFLVWSGNDLLFTVGTTLDVLPPAIFLHLFLAYPTGRLGAALDRLVVAAAYVIAALTVPEVLLGLGGDRNLLALYPATDVADSLQHAQLLAMSGVLLVGIGVLVLRRLGGQRPLRSAFGWMVDAFAIGLLMIALLLGASNLGWTDVHLVLQAPTYFVVGLAPIAFMIGLLQARLVRSSVGDLLLDMGSNPGPTRLQAAVARSLRDPSVRILYWLRERDGYADVDGRRVELAAEEGRSMTPVLRDGETVAALEHDAALHDEPELLAAVAQAVGMTLENSQLQVELQAHLADVRASRARIVTAGDAERRRLERDLHDGAQQQLVALSLALRRARSRVPEAGDAELAASIDDAATLVHDALIELRELARGLHPAILAETGLPGALAALKARSPVPVALLEMPEGRLPAEVEAGAYFFISEALTNVAKHAPAARASVRVVRSNGTLEIEVTDDGPGGAVVRPGSGLQGLEDRMAAAAGRFEITSVAGQGTTLRGWIPLEFERAG